MFKPKKKKGSVGIKPTQDTANMLMKPPTKKKAVKKKK